MTEIFNVLGLEAADDALRAAALALPALVLLTLIALLMKSRRRAQARSRDERLKAFDDRAGPSDAGAGAALAKRTVPVGMAAPTLLGQMPEIVAVRKEKLGAAANMPPAAPSVSAFEMLQSQLDEAMKSAPPATLAPMFLEMARHHKAAGDEASFLAALRSAAGLAARNGPRAVHAEARLELAESAFNSGDLTGACEQWQIAREALNDDGQKDAYARVDKRMRDTGCPTDWVLTDF